MFILVVYDYKWSSQEDKLVYVFNNRDDALNYIQNKMGCRNNGISDSIRQYVGNNRQFESGEIYTCDSTKYFTICKLQELDPSEIGESGALIF